jgi:hypothetical protein
MGENYRPSIRQAALRFDISEEVLRLLVELYGVEPILKDSECSLYRLEDIQRLVRIYRTNRDIAMIKLYRKVEEMDSKVDDMRAELQEAKRLMVPKRRFFLTMDWLPTKLKPQHR